MKTSLFALTAVIPFALIACTSDDSFDDAVTNSDGGPVTTTDASTDATTTSNDAATESDSSTVVFEAGAPITGLTPGAWTWVDVAGAKCRDGSGTGIGVNPSSTGSNKLMIFLEGGGACFNMSTCNANPKTFGAPQFPTFQGAEGNAGIFSRTDSANATKDWNMVYVPYCTGDIHGGSATDVAVSGVVGSQQFVGYDNVTLDLERIVPTFAGTTQVLLTGQSAGGFGAALNYVQTTRAFGSVPVTMLDDSGPLVSNPTLAACLETSMLGLWGMSKTVISDCGSDCSDPGNALSQYWVHLTKTYPSVPLAFLDSAGDGTITTFFGFGADNCTSFTQVPAATYEAGLIDMRTKVAADANAGLFIFGGTVHTSLVTGYTTRTATSSDGGTVKLEDWVTQVVGGTVTNVGP